MMRDEMPDEGVGKDCYGHLQEVSRSYSRANRLSRGIKALKGNLTIVTDKQTYHEKQSHVDREGSLRISD